MPGIPKTGRKKVGMLVPSSNTCLEPVTAELLGRQDRVSVHHSRVPVTRIGLDADSTAQFATEPMLAAARLLADAKVDLIVWNGTAGSWLGPEYDHELVERIHKCTGIPATTSTLALLDACRAYGVTRLGLVVPYEAEVARRIERTYAAAGIEVVASAHLGISDNAAFADVGADEIRRLVAPVAAEQPHAVAIVCTNVFGAPLVAELERRHGVPVFDSVSATLWQALHLVGADVTVTGCGTLLEAGSLRLRLQEALEDLLAVTGADRTTLRLDVPAKGFGCNLTAAEAMRPGVRSIRRDASLPQRRLNTVVWLEEQRRPLVQPHFRAEPSPPQALIEVYGVRAQMLGPIVRGDDMVGWLSVHSLAEREWRDTDLVALAEATGRVHAALDHL